MTHPLWHNAPVPSFGPVDASLLIVGLAPGRNGANRTGRPFTGDYAGDLLYATLLKFGLADGSYRASVDDGLALIDTRITNAVRCLPPENRPTPEEVVNCRGFLLREIDILPRLKTIMALGQIAHRQVVACLGAVQARYPFSHGRLHRIGGRFVLADSYHCSRYNTNTGRLTRAMFEAVIETIRWTTSSAGNREQN